MPTKREETLTLDLDFSKLDSISQCIPVAVQDADTRAVLLVAYTNEKAMRESFRRRRLVLWSTSRGELWEKGLTSGCRFVLVEAFVNCEQNSLLYLVRPEKDGLDSGMCHTKTGSGHPRTGCFYRRINLDSMELENVQQ